MAGKLVALVVFMATLSLDSADAVSCYRCNYTTTDRLGPSTCSEPFNATTAADNCSAPLCTWQFANFTMSSPAIGVQYVHRDCFNESTDTLADICEEFSTELNYTTFNYGDGCCSTSGPVTSDGSTYSFTTCFCQTDNCNGDIPLTVVQLAVDASTVVPSTAAINSTNDSSVLKSSIKNYWALVVVTIVWMVAKFASTGLK